MMHETSSFIIYNCKATVKTSLLLYYKYRYSRKVFLLSEFSKAQVASVDFQPLQQPIKHKTDASPCKAEMANMLAYGSLHIQLFWCNINIQSSFW